MSSPVTATRPSSPPASTPRPGAPIADPVRRRRYLLAVLLILLVSTGVRLWHLGTPPEKMVDEQYYAKDAKAIVDGRVRPRPPYRWMPGDEISWPHAEVGKFAIAAGIVLFGDRGFGWRLPGVIAGVVALACVYPIARRLGLPPPWALVALFLAAADTLGMTMSRIAMLDIYVAAFTALCVWAALQYAQDGRRARWLLASGVAGGLAFGTKWSGALALVAAALIIVVQWWLDRRAARQAERAEAAERAAAARAAAAVPAPWAAQTTWAAQTPWTAETPPVTTVAPAPPVTTVAPAPPVAPIAAAVTPSATAAALSSRAAWQTWLLAIFCLAVLPALIYLASYTQYFIVGHVWSDWWELQRQMLHYNLTLKAEHSYASPPPSWIIDYRPWWNYSKGNEVYRGIIAIGNPFLWWTSLLAVAVTLVLLVRRRPNGPLTAAAALIVVLYVPWFAISRTSFLYYMTPVAPFLAIAVAALLCWFAGRARFPRHAWIIVAVPAVLTAALWEPIGRAAAWLFWALPSKIGPLAGWASVALGVFLALALAAGLLSSRLRPARAAIALVAAGVIGGIAVAFIPLVLALPISLEHLHHIIWLRSWR